MTRKPPQIAIEEIQGNQYNNLATAQREALPLLASHMAQTIRDLLASGVLVQVNGKIIPNTNR